MTKYHILVDLKDAEKKQQALDVAQKFEEHEQLFLSNGRFYDQPGFTLKEKSIEFYDLTLQQQYVCLMLLKEQGFSEMYEIHISSDL